MAWHHIPAMIVFASHKKKMLEVDRSLYFTYKKIGCGLHHTKANAWDNEFMEKMGLF